jgi:uncharacterized protein YecE (DUF72 family)
MYSHWRGRFYPQSLAAKRWFAYYATQFDTVEINNTFYRLPEEGCFDAWRKQAPAGFVYAVKASRYLTHLKKLKDPAEAISRLLSRAARLRDHLGPILYQLPPAWRPDLPRLRDFCSQLPRPFIHVFEFRQADWLREDVFAALAEFGASICIHDILPRHPLLVLGKVAYVRFHGSGARYGGSYSAAALRRWAKKLETLADTGRPVFVYFNNDAEANAVRNARTLRNMLNVPACRPSASA